MTKWANADTMISGMQLGDRMWCIKSALIGTHSFYKLCDHNYGGYEICQL